MAMSSSRTGTTGERGDARGMGIGVEECGQRAGPYVSSFARAACTVQHLAPCSQGVISRAGNISPVFPVSQASRLLRKPLLELTMKALVAAVSACLLPGVQGAARAAAGDEVYARPGQLVAADGTRLNLYCTGRGSPAVVFDSGWEDWAPVWPARIDRKSTRLNSSHEWISYAVFCLKKKNISEIAEHLI